MKKKLALLLAVLVAFNNYFISAAQESKTVVTISFAGDCTLGGYKGQGYSGSFDEMYDNNDASYFFDNVRDIFENDDVTIVNLEGPLTDYTQTVQKQFPIKGKKEYVQMLTDGNIEMVSLANNHTLDCGENGLKETKEVLNNNNIKYAIDSDIAYFTTDSNIKVALLSFKGWNDSEILRRTISEYINTARDNGANIVIVAFHWGEEGTHNSNKTQQTIAHYTIDSGADFVVGHHPHVLQGIEQYNGKTILYSLGNFCFGANKNPKDKDTIIYQQQFIIDNNSVTYGNSKIISCKISSVSNRNDYKPTPCNEEDSKVLLDKLSNYR